MQLSDIAIFVEQSIRSTDICLSEYVTTDSILQNREGRTMATNLPPTPCNLTSYQPGDILMANIRPYLKKVWMADTTGGCSADVLVFRAKENVSSEYLYSVLLQDSFFAYVMLAPKGSKMPRGDKDHIMRFPICDLSNEDSIKVGDLICKIEAKLANNRKQNVILEKLAKQIYDYWFVQFDFPNDEGKPYKSSGGKMVWNETLKREIPDGWSEAPLSSISSVENGATPSTLEEDNYGGNIGWITPKDLSNKRAKFFAKGERSITQKGYDSCSTTLLPAGSILMSSRAPIGLVAIASDEVCTNQGFKNIVPNEINDRFFLFYYIKKYMPFIEAMGNGTTFKEVSKDSLLSFPIMKVNNTNVYRKWVQIAKNIFEKQKKLEMETDELQSLRDYLLPLLMNGQVTIKD